MVDLYIPYDMLGFGVENKVTPAIPLLLAAEYFTRARIKVRINIMRPITIREYRPSPSSIVAITIKDFQDPIDWNKLAVLRGIERAGKVITEMNAAITANKENKYKRNSQNVIAYAEELLYDDEIALQAEFGRYKNWFRKEVEEGRIKSKLVEKPLMLTFSTSGLLGKDFDLANPQDYPDELEKIENGFFEILDSIDLYYNKKEGEVVRRILKRFEQKDPILASNNAKKYIIKLIGKVYRDYEPKSGAFASSNEELEKANENYTSKLKRVSEEFKKLGI
jgi:hypothetical protein